MMIVVGMIMTISNLKKAAFYLLSTALIGTMAGVIMAGCFGIYMAIVTTP